MWKIHWMWTVISFRFQKLASIWIWNGGLGLAVWSAQFRYDTIRLPCPHPGKVNATTARYIYHGLKNMILILEKSMSKLYLLSMWLWKEGSLRAKRSKLALKNRNDRIFLIFFVSLSTPTGLLAQQAWFFLTPFWCHWGTKSRTNGLQQNSSTFNPFVCFSDRTISSFNFFVCFSDRTIIRGWRAGVGALYMVRWSTEGQANAAQVCFLIYNSYSSFKFWWGGIVRKMYDNLWEWDN